MNQALRTLDYAKTLPNRNYLQDVAKVLVEFQQLFIPADPHYWHAGLEVSEAGLSTQKLTINDEEYRCLLDLANACVSLGNKSWSLDDTEPSVLVSELQAWINSQNKSKKIVAPEFSKSKTVLSREYSAQVSSVFLWTEAVFSRLRQTLKDGSLSPILLYPHHFDLAFSWFPGADLQYTIGLSTGDETIAEPYFYVTAYPEPAGFTQTELPSPAYWQASGFSGAILKYDDALNSKDPSAAVINCMTIALGRSQQ